MHSNMLSSLEKAPINKYYDITPIGRIFDILTREQNHLDLYLYYTLENCIIRIFFIIGGIVTSVFYSKEIFLLYPIILIFTAYMHVYYTKAQRYVSKLTTESKTQMTNLYSSCLEGLQTIRTFKVQKKFIERNNILVNQFSSNCYVNKGLINWFNFYICLLTNAITMCCIFTMIWNQNDIKEGNIGLTIMRLAPMSASIFAFTLIWNFQIDMGVYIERTFSLAEIISEHDSQIQDTLHLKLWPQQGSIEFKNVTVKYRENTQIVLKNLSFSIKNGEKVGLIGRTGSGKSSVMLCLLRIIQIENGKILIDQCDISSIELKTLRKKLTIIPQDPIIFQGTLQFNLDPCNEYKEDEIQDVLEQTGLTEMLKKQNQKTSSIMDLMINERGQNLSDGEKQLICIARAILKNSKIILLDEASSSIDEGTSHKIQNLMKQKFKDSTMLIIAHRLETLEFTDKIIALENGIVSQIGTYKDLVQSNKDFFLKKV